MRKPSSYVSPFFVLDGGMMSCWDTAAFGLVWHRDRCKRGRSPISSGCPEIQSASDDTETQLWCCRVYCLRNPRNVPVLLHYLSRCQKPWIACRTKESRQSQHVILLAASRKTNRTTRSMLLVVTHSNLMPDVHQVVRKHMDVLYRSSRMRDVVEDSRIVAVRRNKNCVTCVSMERQRAMKSVSQAVITAMDCLEMMLLTHLYRICTLLLWTSTVKHGMLCTG